VRRRFESADRFWEVALVRACVQLAWGKVGTRGQRHDRDFQSEAEARAYITKHVADLIAKGFAEVIDATAPPEPEALSRNARFEWDEDGERRFLEIVQVQTTVHHRTGMIVDGVDRVDLLDTKHLTSASVANKLFDDKVTEANQRGAARAERRDAIRPAPTTRHHVEPAVVIAAELPPRDDIAEHHELEMQCLESPDSPEPWEVYADYLETQGDPRAKIAALHRAGSTANRIILELLRGIADDEDVEDELRGEADHEINFEFGLRFGFVRHATIALQFEAAIELADATRKFLGAPVARFVDSLRFGLAGYESNNDWTPTLRAVVASAQARRIRSLAFDRFESDQCEWSWVEFGDFTGLLEQLPALEHFRLRSGGGGTLGALALPALKSFVRESGSLRRSELDAIAKARWPNLEHLEIWTGASHYGAEAEVSDFDRILDARDLPRLRHLGIVNSELSDEIIPALAKARVLPQLESLDLRHGIASTQTTEALVQHAAAFRHLASIDLSSNMLRADETTAIRDVLDNVIVAEQREYHEDRYVRVGE
jgi:predicted DNA-binding WGR domain protein